jgi:hypothetical protein
VSILRTHPIPQAAPTNRCDECQYANGWNTPTQTNPWARGEGPVQIFFKSDLTYRLHKSSETIKIKRSNKLLRWVKPFYLGLFCQNDPSLAMEIGLHISPAFMSTTSTNIGSTSRMICVPTLLGCCQIVAPVWRVKKCKTPCTCCKSTNAIIIRTGRQCIVRWARTLAVHHLPGLNHCHHHGRRCCHYSDLAAAAAAGAQAVPVRA